jgi:hypothetical protein
MVYRAELAMAMAVARSMKNGWASRLRFRRRLSSTLRARPSKTEICAKKAPASFEAGALYLNPAASYSSIGRPYSTIGAGGLNGRVRDGIGCDTSAIATGNLNNSFQ